MFLAVDFDNTLVNGYASRHLFQSLGKGPALAGKERLWKAGKIGDAELLFFVASLLEGFSLSEIRRHCGAFPLKPHAREFLKFANSSQLPVVVASQTFREFISPACKELGADHLVASRLRLADGRVKGHSKIISTPEEKLQELESLSQKEGLGGDFVMVGDSRGDSALFSASFLSISVGESLAKYNVPSLREAQEVLASFLEGAR